MSDEPIDHQHAPSPTAAQSGPPPPRRTRVALDQIALVALVFVATLLLLLGATRLLDRRTAGPGPSSSASAAIPSASASTSEAPATTASPGVETGTPANPPVPSPTGDPVLVGAGDIGDCGEDGDEATAKLLDGIAGTVFTVG